MWFPQDAVAVVGPVPGEPGQDGRGTALLRFELAPGLLSWSAIHCFQGNIQRAGCPDRVGPGGHGSAKGGAPGRGQCTGKRGVPLEQGRLDAMPPSLLSLGRRDSQRDRELGGLLPPGPQYGEPE